MPEITMSSIRMTSSILRLQNSFQSMQKVVVALIAVLIGISEMLILDIQGSWKNPFAVGKPKQQIIGQFLIEAMILLWIGFIWQSLSFFRLQIH